MTEPWQPLQTAAEQIRGLLTEENRRRRGQDVRRNVAIGLSVLVGLFGTLVGFSARDDAHAARGQARTAAAALAEYKVDSTRRTLAGDVKDCESRNTIRTGITEFFEGLIAQSANQAQATLASPTADAAEKRRAQATLDSIPQYQTQIREGFAMESCK